MNSFGWNMYDVCYVSMHHVIDFVAWEQPKTANKTHGKQASPCNDRAFQELIDSNSI